MSLSRKLAVSCGAIVALALVLGYYSFQAIRSLGGLLDVAANVAARKMVLVAEIRAGVQEMEDHAKKTQLVHAFHKLDTAGGCRVLRLPCN